MLKYIISSCFLLVQLSLLAQEKPKELPKNKDEVVETVKDSINPFYNPKTYGLRIGVDIIKPIYTFQEDNFSGLEIVADYRLKTNLYVAGEMGYIKKDIDQDYYSHTINGSYLKAGVNYNFFTNWLDMDNELYLGARYGFATFSNTLTSYTINQYGDFFDPKEVTTPIKYSNLNAHWVEMVVGIKVEIFSNVYLGFMGSVSKLIYTKKGDNFDNSYAPGIGAMSENGSGADINYTITYRIPLYKK